MEIEKKLKEAREKAGITQEQVAEIVMVSRQTVSNWENGRSLPDIISVIKLSDLYNVSVDELLKGDQKMQKKIEKDATIAKTNKSVILVTATITLIALAIYLVSIFVGGAFLDFCDQCIFAHRQHKFFYVHRVQGFDVHHPGGHQKAFPQIRGRRFLQ